MNLVLSVRFGPEGVTSGDWDVPRSKDEDSVHTFDGTIADR